MRLTPKPLTPVERAAHDLEWVERDLYRAKLALVNAQAEVNRLQSLSDHLNETLAGQHQPVSF